MTAPFMALSIGCRKIAVITRRRLDIAKGTSDRTELKMTLIIYVLATYLPKSDRMYIEVIMRLSKICTAPSLVS